MNRPEASFRLHNIDPASRANGPGTRAVIWLQGCTLNCPGCFNLTTHDKDGGYETPINVIAEAIYQIQNSIEGITISGGEPLQQLNPLLEFCETIRKKTKLGIILLTGFELAECERMHNFSKLTETIDVLISGRYNQKLRKASGYIGSSNKKVIRYTKRYRNSDLNQVPEAEVRILPNGEVHFTGINPFTLINTANE